MIFTKLNLITWNKNKLQNPFDGKSIKKDSLLYKNLELSYKLVFPNGYDFYDCSNDRDPVSREVFWIKCNNEKKIVYNNLEKLVLYKDKNDKIICFEKESLQHLKYYNILKNPIDNVPIPKKVLDKIPLLKKEELSIYDYSLTIFQKFTEISIYIDHNLFLKLTDKELIVLNNELKSIYDENIAGNLELFNLTKVKFYKLITEDKQRYLLDKIKVILNLNDENLKQFKYYIVLGALSIIIPEIKKNYPDFDFFI